MNRPTILHVNRVVYWVIQTRDPDTLVLKDADSTPTVAIRKNGASTSDSVTPIKRAATTGIYDCEYNPAGEVEGDSYTVQESATVTGTTTGAATYANSWSFGVVTDSIRNALALLQMQVLPDVSYLAHFVAITAAGFSNEIANNIEEGENNWDNAIPAFKSGLALEAKQDAMAGAGFDTATDSLRAIREAVDGIEPTLTGPWTRTITITDSVSTLPIQNATVRFFRTGETESKPTNVSGVASFTVESATWSYAIVASGYAGVTGTVEVSASGDTAVAIVATVPATPTNPNNATLRVICIGEDSQIAPGAIVSIRMIEAPASQVGFGYDGTIATFTADENGIAEREVARGATYEIRREGTYKQWQQFVMPTDEDLILIDSFVQP